MPLVTAKDFDRVEFDLIIRKYVKNPEYFGGSDPLNSTGSFTANPEEKEKLSSEIKLNHLTLQAILSKLIEFIKS